MVVAIVVVALVAVSALIVALFRDQREESRLGCAMSTDCAASTTLSSQVARVIADETSYYARAGLTHSEAACLADVTGRIAPPQGAATVLGTPEQSAEMDRCNISSAKLHHIGEYLDEHPPGTP